MELNVRDWLIILGSLVAAGFVLDAYRRVRSGYSDKLRMSAKTRDDDEDDLINPELPAGGARVVSRSKTVPSYDQPAQDPSDEETHVPVLMESVDEETPDVSRGEDDLPVIPASQASASEPELRSDAEATAQDSLGVLAESPSAEPAATIADPVPPRSSPQAPAEKKHQPPATAKESPATDSAAKKPGKAESGNTKSSTGQGSLPDEIILLHVVAHKGETIAGSPLLQILLACDVRFGEMDIFHRYEEAGGAGAEQFSVANIVSPGTFDLETMEHFTTPGVTFFMRLPGPKDAIKAFDCMVETANVLVKNLGCELQDEARSVCTPQTIQHLRQRIRDFERRQLTLV